MNDDKNEGNKSQLQSQTETAKAYSFTSKNGVEVLIIDTPGLNDTRGGDYDEKHKGSIAKVIAESVTSLNAVLILANGTLARLSASTEYALNALTEIFPKDLEKNISILFTNCASLANLNFEDGGIPPALADAPRYTLDNPYALQKRIQKRREGQQDPDLNSPEAAKRKKAQRKEQDLRSDENETLERAYSKALKMLVEFFDQVLDNTPQGTKSLIELRDKAVAMDTKIASAITLLDEISQNSAELKRLKAEIEKNGQVSRSSLNFRKTTRRIVDNGPGDDLHTTLCSHDGQCRSNCHSRCASPRGVDFADALRRCGAFWHNSSQTWEDNCDVCQHSWASHYHHLGQWKDTPDRTQDEINAQEKEYRDNANKGGTLKAQKALFENEKAKLESDRKTALTNIATITDEYSAMNLTGDFIGGVIRSINLLEVQRKAQAQKDPDTAQRIQSMIDVLKNKKSMLEEAARQKATKKV
ncbi:hypothetical protein DL93DRAFT_2064614 [Clavulina sp. PMI_390]|nr:hypothetical protein DL93DRAFT_2064614 [Clavulina sp. PMI_390]